MDFLITLAVTGSIYLAGYGQGFKAGVESLKSLKPADQSTSAIELVHKDAK